MFWLLFLGLGYGGAMTNPEVIAKVAFYIETDRLAEAVIAKVIEAIEQTLLDHIHEDGFTIKLGSLGRFTVRHKAARKMKNPFTGDVVDVAAKRKVKFTAYGPLRGREKLAART